MKETFEKRFDPMRASAEGLHVQSEASVRETIREFVAEGAITTRQAELLLGHIGCQSAGIPTHAKSAQRRRRELRRLGLALALDGDEGERLDVDLAAELDDALGAGAWDA